VSHALKMARKTLKLQWKVPGTQIWTDVPPQQAIYIHSEDACRHIHLYRRTSSSSIRDTPKETIYRPKRNNHALDAVWEGFCGRLSTNGTFQYYMGYHVYEECLIKEPPPSDESLFGRGINRNRSARQREILDLSEDFDSDDSLKLHRGKRHSNPRNACRFDPERDDFDESDVDDLGFGQPIHNVHDRSFKAPNHQQTAAFTNDASRADGENLNLLKRRFQNVRLNLNETDTPYDHEKRPSAPNAGNESQNGPSSSSPRRNTKKQGEPSTSSKAVDNATAAIPNVDDVQECLGCSEEMKDLDVPQVVLRCCKMYPNMCRKCLDQHISSRLHATGKWKSIRCTRCDHRLRYTDVLRLVSPDIRAM
jgi:hypothetical protein